MARPPERDRQMVGGIGSADRAMASYTPGRDAVEYEPGGSWLAVVIIVILVIVTFGVMVLSFMRR
ncbi:MAG: hypothetical protein ACREDF_08660 [Thermoplasmata archaeon]